MKTAVALVARHAHLVAFARITIDSDTMGGMPTIRGLHIPGWAKGLAVGGTGSRLGLYRRAGVQ